MTMRDLIYLSLFCTFLCLVNGQDPEITERILPEIKRLGVTGRLNCTVINQQTYPVVWINKALGIYISKNEKILIEDEFNITDMGKPKYEVSKYTTGERVTYQLIVNRLERKDAGTYICLVHAWSTGGAQYPYKEGEMVVMFPPSVLQARTLYNVTVNEGEPLNLTCDAEGYPVPNITWVRVNGGVLPNGKLRIQSKFLYIEQVAAQDRGVYRCLADNYVPPPAFFDSTVFIYFPPVAKAIQSSYGQAENRMLDVTLECRIAGWPEPELQWYQIGDYGEYLPLDEDHRHNILILLNHANILQPQERWFQLIIRSVTANDFGEFVCEGENRFGTNEARIKLFATSECQGPNCPSSGGNTSGAAYIQTLSLLHWALILVATILCVIV